MVDKDFQNVSAVADVKAAAAIQTSTTEKAEQDLLARLASINNSIQGIGIEYEGTDYALSLPENAPLPLADEKYRLAVAKIDGTIHICAARYIPSSDAQQGGFSGHRYIFDHNVPLEGLGNDLLNKLLGRSTLDNFLREYSTYIGTATAHVLSPKKPKGQRGRRKKVI